MKFCRFTGIRCRFILLSICIFYLWAPEITFAAQEPTNEAPAELAPKSIRSRPLCGLCCLYTVMKSCGKNVNFTDLLKPRYIGAFEGSSLQELERAAEDNKFYAEPVEKLTPAILRQCPYKTILHVKSRPDSKQYDHYELFLGTERAKATIYDPPEPIKLVPYHELIARWDGCGLIVSPQPINVAKVFAPARRRFALHASVIVGVLLLIHAARRFVPASLSNTRTKRLALSAVQGVSFGVAALVIGLLYHFVAEGGFLAHAGAAYSVQQAYQGSFIPKISETTVGKLIGSDAVFIDTRYADDFETGHLNGAINIPPNMRDGERRNITAAIAKNSRIVLYCQSPGCKFAEIVALKLVADGFSNISVFRGKWSKWVVKSNPQMEKSTWKSTDE